MARIFLTRRAKLHLDEIESFSKDVWGETRTKKYMADLYSGLAKTAQNPESGQLRQHRSTPYLMAPAEKHFIVYKAVPQGIIVAAILHHRRDVESAIARTGTALMEEITRM